MKHSFKKEFRRFLCFLMTFIMILTSMPVHLLAANVDHNNLSNNKSEIINNKTPVKVAKPEGKAEDLIKNPDQPAIYTLRTDYKVQKGEKYEINYQPYVASVGESASDDEKAKVKKEITLPDIAGYKKPLDDTFTIDYDTVKDAADDNNKTGDDKNGWRYSADEDYRYKAKSNDIKIKHLFQDMKDFTKYTNLGGADKPEKITTQNGNTGSTMEVSPLNENDRRGFIPEAKYITMQVPEDATDFVLEYRYNRAYYNVDFDTMGGTALPTRTCYYDQEIPKIKEKDIPTKVGCDFLGWKPSHDLQTTDGKTTYKAGEIINKADGKPAFDLDVKLKMPALLLGKDIESRERLKFTAVWKDKKKADYAIQFWAEKADHDDNASLLDKYDYMGTHVYKDAETGSKPNLDTVSVDKIPFPDLDQKRLKKIWAGEKFYAGQYLYLNKFFVYNKDLTDKQNIDSKTNVTKTVSATGKTVYNIYYDRQVYDLYFTKSNVLGEKETFYPEIYVPDGNGGARLAGGPGNPYHFSARFNQLMLGWPNDAMQTKGFTPGMQSYGWGPNYGVPQWPLHLDTPPYRLNADEFLDMPGYDDKGGYVNQIDKGDGTFIDVKNDPRYKDEPYKALSFGIKQEGGSMPHHMDFWMDGFKKGETIIRYDLYRSKADTNSLTYDHRYSKVQGFTPYGSTIEEGKEEHGRITEDDIDTLNEERGEITPYPDKDYTDTFGFNNAVGQLHFWSAFFNNANEFGDPIEGDAFETNGYIRFKYKRNKYPLRFNYDPSKIKDDSAFNEKNSLETFYEFPLKVLSPELVADDTPREDKEYFKDNPKNLLDDPKNLQTLGLTDLVFTDKDGKLKVKRPDGLSDQMVFKGWALDPAGNKLIWENPKEKMPTHALNLYAKWGEPDYKWKVTFDPNGGKLRNIKEEKLTTERKKIQEGDIGQEEVNTYAKKGYLKEAATTEDGKQIFTVIQRQKLVEPVKPERKGYDFMGWEVVRYKKDTKGDYTDEIDTSYRDKYGVPELYTFGNDVVGPVYLKAIWNPNQRVDVKVVHHILDKNCKEEKKITEWLEDKRTGYYTATVGDKQGETLILAPHAELEKTEDENVKKQYEEYNKIHKFNNTYFQNQRIEPEKIIDTEKSTEKETVYKANPAYKGNEFHFFYRPFRQREYTVNYLDEQGKSEVDKFFADLKLTDTAGLTGNELLEANESNKEKFEKNKSKLEEILKKYQVVDPEDVSNGNRHFDARNYRQIPGWTLTSNPQQQLFFDLNEDTNEFLGINGTGSDQIFFYYKDVRVIEVPKDGKTPDGYVRVTYKIDDKDKGGAFTDKDGKSVTELHYDVIKGLKSDLLPEPKELEEGKEKEAGKYYVTPETGKKFTKWDKSPLLNKNTIINENHTFTAYFEWSGLSATGLVRTEAFKDDKADAKKDWTNNFAPTIDQLKKQLVWREKDQVKDLPAGTEIKLFDEAGKELTEDKQVYDLVNEKKAADKDQLVRTVNVKAKVTFKDGKETQELDIPITVYKNVYEALNKDGDKPLFLKEAEGKDAKDGGLKDVTGNYVKVTIQPTEKNTNKDAKIYYVNPEAWVNIPEVSWSQDDKDKTDFLNWTADKKAQNEKDEKGNQTSVFDFSKRHMFTDEETLIKPLFTKEVVEQKDKDKKPNVPDSYVKVVVDKTKLAKLGTDEPQKLTFWVNPTKEVAITVANPNGKTDQEVDLPKLGKKKVNYVFKEWQKVKTGEDDNNLVDIKKPAKIDLAKNKYTDKVTVIEAAYKNEIQAEKLVEPLKTTKLDTPQGKEITNDDLIKKITPLEGKVIESIEVISKPDGNTVGNEPAKVIVKYKDGTTQGTNDDPVVIPVEVHDNIIPAKADGSKPEKALENYKKVIFKVYTNENEADYKVEGGSLGGNLIYYVSPEVEVNLTDTAKAITKTPFTGYTANGENWTNTANKTLQGKFTDEVTEFAYKFAKTKDIVEKTDDPNQVIPKGYVTVIFKTEDEKKGKLEGDVKEKIYYVNPKAEIKLVELQKGQSTGEKQLAVPETAPAANYEFDKWQEAIDVKTAITNDRTHVAIFKSGQVTLTYDKGGNDVTGEVPAAATVNYGTTVGLAGKGTLAKPNAEFAGWKLDNDEKIYKPGDQVKLEKARTATAQWTSTKHTVTFDTKGESKVPSQQVEHGKTSTKPTKDPTQAGKVFMGWKEKESDTNYFDFNTPIKENKTLIAIWQKPVQKIGENDPVEEQFIKVTFLKGSHGTLKDGETPNLEKVTYKVAKGLKFEDAKGLKVPAIAPAKYYKAKEENAGWDKALDLTLAAGETEKVFIAQYEPKADVIPVDPKVTPDDKLQDDKPEGMVLVEFKVSDDNSFYIPKNAKYYVKKEVEVRVPTPVVLEKTTDTVFNGWQDVKLVEETLNPADKDPKAKKFIWVKQSFKEDTVISDEKTFEIKLIITKPSAGDKRIYIEQMSDDSIGKIELIRNGNVIESAENKKFSRRRKEYNVFDFNNELQSGDLIRYWQESSTKISDYTTEHIN